MRSGLSSMSRDISWWRGQDLNLRPSGYESSEFDLEQLVPVRVAPDPGSSRRRLSMRSWALVGRRLSPSCSRRVRGRPRFLGHDAGGRISRRSSRTGTATS